MSRSRDSILVRNKQSNFLFEGGEVDRLKARFADISYRHGLEKAARMHLETIYDKATQNESIATEKYNALEDEFRRLRQECSKSNAVRRTLEDRLKNYSQTRRHLEYQLDMERRSRQCSESHVTILANSLELMGRLLQVQFPSGIENPSSLGQRDIMGLQSETTVITGAQSPPQVSNVDNKTSRESESKEAW